MKEFIEYLKKEEKQAFKGWDFSYIDSRWEHEKLPWNYKEIVLSNLKDSDELLDMGTGGGEFLLTLNHPYNKTTVTEGYKPNFDLCCETLIPLGIKVYQVFDDNKLIDIKDNSIDIVINRHEEFDLSEVKRVLKKDGLFITQQVGKYNNKDLVTYFDKSYKAEFSDNTLDIVVQKLKGLNFKINKAEESYPIVKFYDIGALVFFAKVICWEFKDFSVDRYTKELTELNERLQKNKDISSTEHRFLIIAKNNG